MATFTWYSEPQSLLGQSNVVGQVETFTLTNTNELRAQISAELGLDDFVVLHMSSLARIVID